MQNTKPDLDQLISPKSSTFYEPETPSTPNNTPAPDLHSKLPMHGADTPDSPPPETTKSGPAGPANIVEYAGERVVEDLSRRLVHYEVEYGISVEQMVDILMREVRKRALTADKINVGHRTNDTAGLVGEKKGSADETTNSAEEENNPAEDEQKRKPTEETVEWIEATTYVGDIGVLRIRARKGLVGQAFDLIKGDNQRLRDMMVLAKEKEDAGETMFDWVLKQMGVDAKDIETATAGETEVGDAAAPANDDEGDDKVAAAPATDAKLPPEDQNRVTAIRPRIAACKERINAFENRTAASLPPCISASLHHIRHFLQLLTTYIPALTTWLLTTIPGPSILLSIATLILWKTLFELAMAAWEFHHLHSLFRSLYEKNMGMNGDLYVRHLEMTRELQEALEQLPKCIFGIAAQ